MPTERSEQQQQPSDGGGVGGETQFFVKGRSRLSVPFRIRKQRTDDSEKRRQVQDYIAWVNNYLKRRPRAPLITDLKTALQDGVTLVNLVEVAANAEIPFIDRNPSSSSARRGNIEKAVAFLVSDGVNLQSDPGKDIMDCNMKGIMRVILGIAERYNPRSVRPINRAGPPPPPVPDRNAHHPSPPVMARSSSPDRRLDGFGHRGNSPRATSPMTNAVMMSSSSHGASLSQGFALSQGFCFSQSFGLSQGVPSYSLSQPTPTPHSVDGIYSTPIDSLPQNVTQKISSQMPQHRLLGHHRGTSKPVAKNVAQQPPPPPPARNSAPSTETESTPSALSDVHGEITGVMGDLGAFKTSLLQLHSLLLDNKDGDVPVETADVRLPLEVANAELSSREKKVNELQDSIVQSKEQYTQLEAECETLRGMVVERDNFIRSMRSEIYRKEYRNDTERIDLQTQLIQRDKVIKDLEEEVVSAKGSMELREKEVYRLRDSIGRETELKAEIDRLTMELGRVSAAEEMLRSKLAGRDRKIAFLEEQMESKGHRPVDSGSFADDMDSIREKLTSLRSGLLPSDPQQHVIDALEKNISDTIGKISEHSSSLSPARRPRRHHDHDDRRRRNRDRKHSGGKEEAVEWTKVFYYMSGDKSETPYVTSVPRKSSEVRLKDFRAVFDRHGNYRFYFKTADPDCGVVREEIIHEDMLLPQWNGKIIVWVSEKSHHR